MPSTEDPPIRLERLAFGKDSQHSGGAFLYPAIPYRILSITLLLTIEVVAASLWLDTESLRHGGPFTRTVAYCAPWCVRASIAFAAALAIIGFIRFRAAARLVFPRIERAPISLISMAVHAAAVMSFCVLAQLLFGSRQLAAGVSDLLTGGCLVACFLVVVSVVCAFVPLPLCLELIRCLVRIAWWDTQLLNQCSDFLINPGFRLTGCSCRENFVLNRPNDWNYQFFRGFNG